MATGYDEDGVEDLICGAPPDAGVDGDGPAPDPCEVNNVELATFVPNCFTGVTFPARASFPTYNFGVGNFSLEFWRRWASNEVACGWGTTVHSPGLSDETHAWTVYGAANLHLFNSFVRNSNMQGHIQFVGGGANEYYCGFFGPLSNEPFTVSEWVHWAVNVERGSFATMYRNGAAFDVPVDISAHVLIDLGVLQMYPPSSNANTDTRNATTGATFNYDGDGEAYPLDLTGGGGVEVAMSLWGPWAWHNRLLTVAEMGESYRGRTVQNAAMTIQAVDPADIFGHTAWDCCPNRMVHGVRTLIDLQGHEIGAPVGADGAVFMRDLSGNVRHVALRTRAQYASASVTVNAVDDPAGATDCRATVGFVADPTWT